MVDHLLISDPSSLKHFKWVCYNDAWVDKGCIHCGYANWGYVVSFESASSATNNTTRLHLREEMRTWAMDIATTPYQFASGHKPAFFTHHSYSYIVNRVREMEDQRILLLCTPSVSASSGADDKQERTPFKAWLSKDRQVLTLGSSWGGHEAEGCQFRRKDMREQTRTQPDGL